VAKSSNFELFTRAGPKLIGEFKTCNMVSYRGAIWSLPQFLGEVNLRNPAHRADPRIRHAATIEAVITMVEQGESDARSLFGEGAKYDVINSNGEWLAMPHAVGLTDGRDPALLQGRGVLRAASREELVTSALGTGFSELAEVGADFMRVAGKLHGSPSPPMRTVDAPHDIVAGATEDRSIFVADDWYYSIEMSPGVVTPGRLGDSAILTRRLLKGCQLEGTRCLDIGPMEGMIPAILARRGAKAITAIDVTLQHADKIASVKNCARVSDAGSIPPQGSRIPGIRRRDIFRRSLPHPGYSRLARRRSSHGQGWRTGCG
jgi:hypothetical protein